MKNVSSVSLNDYLVANNANVSCMCRNIVPAQLIFCMKKTIGSLILFVATDSEKLKSPCMWAEERQFYLVTFVANKKR